MNRYIALKSGLISSLILALVGIIAIISGLVILVSKSIQAINSFEVTATVVSVIDTDETHEIGIEYTIDGVTYDATLPYWNEELDKNSSVKIYVSKDDPTKFYGSKKGYIYLTIFLLAMGIPTFLFKFNDLVSYKKEKKRIEYLLTKNKHIAKIICVEENNRNISMGVTPVRVIVSITIDEVEYVLPSKDLYVKNDISGLVGKNIDLYSEDNEFKNYYIDILSINL